MVHLERRLNRFFKCRRGYSGIIATIFMVLVVMYLFYNIFVFTQNQSFRLQDLTSQSQQLDVDRNSEHLEVNFTCTHLGGGNYNVEFTVRNTGPLTVQILRLWVQNSAESTSIPISPVIVLQPGEETSPPPLTFQLNGTPSGHVPFWLVTARGNLVANSTLVT
jgi:hypothetical protein